MTVRGNLTSFWKHPIEVLNKKKYGLRDGAINRILYALEFFRFEQYVKAFDRRDPQLNTP